jgi:hypothetical protein
LVSFFLQRLDAKYEENPAANAMLYDIIRAEVANKTAKGSSSCTNGMLWLTRWGFSHPRALWGCGNLFCEFRFSENLLEVQTMSHVKYVGDGTQSYGLFGGALPQLERAPRLVDVTVCFCGLYINFEEISWLDCKRCILGTSRILI